MALEIIIIIYIREIIIGQCHLVISSLAVHQHHHMN